MTRPQQAVHQQIWADDLALLIEIFLGLFEDNLTLGIDVAQQGALQHGGQELQAIADMARMQAAVVIGRFGIGGRVDVAADGFEATFQVLT